MDRGAWEGATVHGVSKELDVTEWPSTYAKSRPTFLYTYLVRHLIVFNEKPKSLAIFLLYSWCEFPWFLCKLRSVVRFTVYIDATVPECGTFCERMWEDHYQLRSKRETRGSWKGESIASISWNSKKKKNQPQSLLKKKDKKEYLKGDESFRQEGCYWRNKPILELQKER